MLVYLPTLVAQGSIRIWHCPEQSDGSIVHRCVARVEPSAMACEAVLIKFGHSSANCGYVVNRPLLPWSDVSFRSNSSMVAHMMGKRRAKTVDTHRIGDCNLLWHRHTYLCANIESQAPDNKEGKMANSSSCATPLAASVPYLMDLYHGRGESCLHHIQS